MKVVIAGNYRQFQDWMREQDLPPTAAIYADSTEKIMGLELSPSDVVYVGEHWLSEVDRYILRSRIRKP